MKNDRLGPNKEMNNGWLTFYTRIKPWLVILVTVIWAFARNPMNHIIQTAGTINSVLYTLGIDPINWINAGSEYWANVTVVVVCILGFLLPVIPNILCLVLSGISYKKYVSVIKLSLFIDLLTIAFLAMVIMTNILGFIVVLLVGYPTWYLLNVKYFKARVVNP